MNTTLATMSLAATGLATAPLALVGLVVTGSGALMTRIGRIKNR